MLLLSSIIHGTPNEKNIQKKYPDMVIHLQANYNIMAIFSKFKIL